MAPKQVFPGDGRPYQGLGATGSVKPGTATDWLWKPKQTTSLSRTFKTGTVTAAVEISEVTHRALSPGPGMRGSAREPSANVTAVNHDHPRLPRTSQPVENGEK